MRTLVIVESFAKSVTISKYLGNSYTVKCCFGHTRDLPRNEDLTPEHKRTPWAELGVNTEGQYELFYIVPVHREGDLGPDKRILLNELAQEVKRHDDVILATDPDREGEAIAFSLQEQLRLPKNVKRVAFNEVTEDAIKAAITRPRRIDMNLVDAQKARRALDRLCGYKISPVTRRVVASTCSAGRVQSAALAALVEQEWAILSHFPTPYVSMKIQLPHQDSTFAADLVQIEQHSVATPKDFLPTGQLNPESKAVMLKESEARALAQQIRGKEVEVVQATQGPYSRRPPPPFTTSTLQQQASTQLKIDPAETMSIAQSLYEAGLITYMRTDSVNLSAEAIQAARDAATALFGAGAVPANPRVYVTKAKNAQEAHEAIRPSGHTFTPPDRATLDGKPLAGNALAVYDLIFRRTVASQMQDVESTKTTLLFSFGSYIFRTVGRAVMVPGFTALYQDAKDAKDKDDDSPAVPYLKGGDKLVVQDSKVDIRNTPTPARYTQASIVQALEAAEVARPSTYVSIVQTLLNRGFVKMVNRQMVVTWLGLLQNRYLVDHFSLFTNAQFTALMEEHLDHISNGKQDYLTFMRHFWTKELQPSVLKAPSIPPVVTLPKAPGIRVQMIDDQPHIVQGNAKFRIPEAIFPHHFTAEVAQKIMSGSPGK